MNKLVSLASLLMILLGWYILSLNIGNQHIVPNPYSVSIEILHIITNIKNIMIILYSLLRLFISISIAGLLGITIGFLAAKITIIDDFCKPIISVLRTTPIAAIIIILLVLLGRINSVYVIVFLILFPIVYEAVKGGVLNIDKSIVDALDLEQSTLYQSFYYIYLPLTIPHIKIALLQSVGLGFKVLVMAEFIAQTNNSIGIKLYEASISINYATIFAWSILIILLAITIEVFINKIKSL